MRVPSSGRSALDRGPRARLTAALSAGWIPAVLAYAASAGLLHRAAQVSARDLGVLTLWWVWMLVVPGTVLWRLVDRGQDRTDEGRSLPQDLILGSAVGIVALIPVYLLTVALKVPEVALAWPALVVGLALLRRDGRRHPLLLRCTPTPTWWSWSIAGSVVFLALISYPTWSELALTPDSFRMPYVDEPYHLSLVAEFRHHFPAETPYVDGTPLRYHWLVYPLIAAASWGTGTEPVILLRLLVPAFLTVMMPLGVAVAAIRLSGHRWAGVAASVIVLATSPLDVFGWTDAALPWVVLAFLSYLSPTQVMANALGPLLVVLLVGLVRGERARPIHWLATGLVMLAVAGSKSAMLPVFIAGLCGAAVVVLVVTRRVPWRLVGAAGLSLGVFGLATAVFYGSGSRALEVRPFQVVDLKAAALGLTETGTEAAPLLRTSLLLVFVLCTLVQLSGGLGLMARGGWRSGVPWMLGGASIAGLVAVMVLHAPSLTEFYFYRSTLAITATVVAAGWAHAVGPVTRRSVVALGAALLVGLGLGYLIPALTSDRPVRLSAQTDGARLLISFAVPLGLAALSVLTVAVTAYVVSRRAGDSGSSPRRSSPPSSGCACPSGSVSWPPFPTVTRPRHSATR